MANWEGINEFVAVVETQSFTAAAERLSTSVANISRRVLNWVICLYLSTFSYRCIALSSTSLLASFFPIFFAKKTAAGTPHMFFRGGVVSSSFRPVNDMGLKNSLRFNNHMRSISPLPEMCSLLFCWQCNDGLGVIFGAVHHFFHCRDLKWGMQ